MIGSFDKILGEALERLTGPAAAALPRIIAALAIVILGLACAHVARWLAARGIKASRLDHFLANSGLASLLGFSSRFRAARAVVGIVYWSIVLVTLLAAVDAFDMRLTSRAIEAAVLLLPKLVTAGAIVLAGMWVGQYLGRSTLVWACNEELARPRLLAGAVRTAIVLVAVAAAADHLDFARAVFLTGFAIVFAGGVAALGVGVARGWFSRREEERAESLWNHL